MQAAFTGSKYIHTYLAASPLGIFSEKSMRVSEACFYCVELHIRSKSQLSIVSLHPCEQHKYDKCKKTQRGNLMYNC